MTNIELTTQSGSNESGGGPTIMFGGGNVSTPVVVHGTVPVPQGDAAPSQPSSGTPQGEVEVASVRVSLPTRSQSAASSPTR